MRLNQYIASCTPLSRRAADIAIQDGRVTLASGVATTGLRVESTDIVYLDGVQLFPREKHTTILLNKPIGYVCSRAGQGGHTIYELLPQKYQDLQPVGRLDKNSSGLLLLTDDGELADKLTHPRFAKTKIYEITLDKTLQPLHQQMISDHGVVLEDGRSQFLVHRQETVYSNQQGTRGTSSETYQITMTEGRNRQIRRTFAALGYTVTSLHRTHFGPYALRSIPANQWETIT